MGGCIFFLPVFPRPLRDTIPSVPRTLDEYVAGIELEDVPVVTGGCDSARRDRVDFVPVHRKQLWSFGNPPQLLKYFRAASAISWEGRGLPLPEAG